MKEIYFLIIKIHKNTHIPGNFYERVDRGGGWEGGDMGIRGAGDGDKGGQGQG